MAKSTLWPSAKEMCQSAFPGLWDQVETNKSGGAWTIKINDSEILFGGLDDKERVEKHLGAEYATVYINECSEIQDENAVNLIMSFGAKYVNEVFLQDGFQPPFTLDEIQMAVEFEEKAMVFLL